MDADIAAKISEWKFWWEFREFDAIAIVIDFEKCSSYQIWITK